MILWRKDDPEFDFLVSSEFEDSSIGEIAGIRVEDGYLIWITSNGDEHKTTWGFWHAADAFPGSAFDELYQLVERKYPEMLL